MPSKVETCIAVAALAVGVTASGTLVVRLTGEAKQPDTFRSKIADKCGRVVTDANGKPGKWRFCDATGNRQRLTAHPAWRQAEVFNAPNRALK